MVFLLLLLLWDKKLFYTNKAEVELYFHNAINSFFFILLVFICNIFSLLNIATILYPLLLLLKFLLCTTIFFMNKKF